MRRDLLSPAACIFLFSILPAAAQSTDLPSGPASPPPELNEIVVTATRIDSPILESPSLVTVITGKDLVASGASNLAEVLTRQCGVVVNDYGPQGQGKTVSIRGATSSQVLVLLDGIRLNSSFDGYLDLSRIPVANIDRVEIVQGGTSSLWGTGAIGGVINVITRKAEAPTVDVSLTNRSYLPHDASSVVTESEMTFPYTTSLTSAPASAASLVDGQNVNLFLAGRLGEVGLTGGGSFTRAANAFTWNDTSSLNGWRQMTNAQDLAESAFASLQVPALEGTLSVKGTFDHSLIGVPGSLSYPSTQAGQQDTTAMGSFALTTNRFLADSLTLDLKGAYRYAQETFNDPLSPPESVHSTNAANLDLTQKATLSDALSVVYGGSASYEQVDSTNLSGGDRRLSLAGFLSFPFLPAETLTITPSVRYDYYSDFPGYLSFQLAAVWAVSDVSSLHATVATAYSAPTLSELYWTDPFGDIGNPNLKPETSYSGEIGYTLQREGVTLQAATFARVVYNQIEWVYNSVVNASQPVNVTQTFLPGVEVHGKLDLTDRFSVRADYAFIYSFLLHYPFGGYQFSGDQRVPWTPVHNLTFGVDYKDSRNTAGIELQYVSEKSYYDSGISAWNDLPSYVLLNASYGFRISDTLALSIQLKNILNTLYYTEADYPMPPFSIVTGVQLHL